jgi:hypothetical protein
MPKIKIPYKSFNFRGRFSSDKDSLVIKPEFKSYSKTVINYIENNFIFKLPEVHSELIIPPRHEQFRNLISLNPNRPKQITSNKTEKERVKTTEKTIIQNIQIKSEEKTVITIAEIKKQYYYFLKFLRLISFYSIAPYNLILFLHNFQIYSVDWFIFHLFISNACLFMPYFLTEDWVTKISYDKLTNKLHITKINIRCKEYTTTHSPEKMVRIHRKNNIRFFSLFKNKSTNEHFSIQHICDIKNEILLNSLIPEKHSKAKKGTLHKVNIENSSGAYFKYYLKIVLIVYFSAFFGIVFYKLREIKKDNEMIILD